MREDDSNWFSNWEDDLPSPDELTPLSSTLISPDLALAFDIQNPNATHSAAADAAANAGEGGNSGEEPARTLKRPRLVWTPQLHKRFVDAVTQLGIKNAVPKTIMQLMSVDGLTRENVASHLQKYRLYLKRMHGGGCSGGDSGTEHFVPYAPVAAPGLHHPRMEALASTGNRHAPVQALYQHHRQLDHFGLQANGQLEHAFLSRQAQMESGTGANGREVLTLFPNGHD